MLESTLCDYISFGGANKWIFFKLTKSSRLSFEILKIKTDFFPAFFVNSYSYISSWSLFYAIYLINEIVIVN